MSSATIGRRSAKPGLSATIQPANAADVLAGQLPTDISASTPSPSSLRTCNRHFVRKPAMPETESRSRDRAAVTSATSRRSSSQKVADILR